MKNNSAQLEQNMETNSSTLFISHFGLSDVGEYICQVTVDSSHLNDSNATGTFHGSFIVTYQSEW